MWKKTQSWPFYFYFSFSRRNFNVLFLFFRNFDLSGSTKKGTLWDFLHCHEGHPCNFPPPNSQKPCFFFSVWKNISVRVERNNQFWWSHSVRLRGVLHWYPFCQVCLLCTISLVLSYCTGCVEIEDSSFIPFRHGGRLNLGSCLALKLLVPRLRLRLLNITNTIPIPVQPGSYRHHFFSSCCVRVCWVPWVKQ